MYACAPTAELHCPVSKLCTHAPRLQSYTALFPLQLPVRLNILLVTLEQLVSLFIHSPGPMLQALAAASNPLSTAQAQRASAHWHVCASTLALPCHFWIWHHVSAWLLAVFTCCVSATWLRSQR